MKKKRCHKIFVSILLAFFVFSINSIAQEKQFPIRPINIHVGFAPGGAVGLTGMPISEVMKKYLKQPVIINYKPGAAQGVAADFIKNCAPDGYNLFYAELEALAVKLVIEGEKLSFKYENFEPIGAACYGSHLLAVNIDSPWKTIEELITDAKKSPGKISLGNTGFGTGTHFKGMIFCKKNSIVFNHIPYAGGGPLINALLGKHVDAGISTVTALTPHVKSGGGLRGLLILGPEREADLPNIPTSLEKGYAVPAYYMGLLAPKGLQEGVRAVLVRAFQKTIEDPETIAALNKLPGIKIKYLSPNEINVQMEEYRKIFQDIWKDIAPTK